MSLQQEWRSRAASLQEQLDTLLSAEGVSKAQVTAQHALAMREILPALADMLDVIEAAGKQFGTDTVKSKIAARNNTIRLASIKALETGNWDEFNRIIDEQLATKT